MNTTLGLLSDDGLRQGCWTFERHVDIDYEGVPVSPYCLS